MMKLTYENNCKICFHLYVVLQTAYEMNTFHPSFEWTRWIRSRLLRLRRRRGGNHIVTIRLRLVFSWLKPLLNQTEQNWEHNVTEPIAARKTVLYESKRSRKRYVQFIRMTKPLCETSLTLNQSKTCPIEKKRMTQKKSMSLTSRC